MVKAGQLRYILLVTNRNKHRSSIYSIEDTIILLSFLRLIHVRIAGLEYDKQFCIEMLI